MRCFLLGLLSLALFAQPASDLDRALQPYRRRIDDVDAQLMKLLNQRAEIVRDIAGVKQRFHAPVSAPGREQQVLARVAAQARPPLPPENARRIFQTILAEMSSMEQREMHP